MNLLGRFFSRIDFLVDQQIGIFIRVQGCLSITNFFHILLSYFVNVGVIEFVPLFFNFDKGKVMSNIWKSLMNYNAL